MLNNQSILITGGTGTFGNTFVRTILTRYPGIKRLVVFSRDELKQFEMAQEFPDARHKAMRYFLGDIRDPSRLRRAMEGIDIVIHAAALKQVPAAEYNPFECIKTNVVGAQNVIEACLDSEVQKVIALSTDKAAAPINLYGATKLCSDKLFVAANTFKGKRAIKFSVVRYGNVFGSRGSVVPFFLSCRQQGKPLPVTHPEMTRFSITADEGVDMVLKAIDIMQGGEIFVPKIPSYRILDIVEAISPGREIKVVGLRPGEKLHEEMITGTDALNSLEFSDYYVILPTAPLWDVDHFISTFTGKRCQPGFQYASDKNKKWLSVETIRSLIRTHLDPNFS